jgi:hypothetical protein
LLAKGNTDMLPFAIQEEDYLVQIIDEKRT